MEYKWNTGVLINFRHKKCAHGAIKRFFFSEIKELRSWV
jgi:hypothetical protein